MRTLKLAGIAAAVLIPLFACNCPASKKNDNSGQVKNVIFMIGDGMGLAQVCAIEGDNNFERADNICLSKTYSANRKVTDSAAGGTALACGVKTNNGMIGMTPDTLPAVSIMEILEEETGMSTGIVVSCEMFHATPASFYAHQPDRGMSEAIAKDLYESRLDFIAGGRGRLVSPDSLEAAGFTVCRNLGELQKAGSGRIAAFTAENFLGKAPDRKDSLSLAVNEALRILGQNENGFFLMIESSQIDWSCHGNDSTYLRAEMAETNNIVGKCFDYADSHPGTLVVITADHETGGVTLLGENKTPDFSTGEHTGVFVPVYLYGTGADKINGIMENSSIRNKILELLSVNQ